MNWNESPAFIVELVAFLAIVAVVLLAGLVFVKP